jgi:hypothetical protein
MTDAPPIGGTTGCDHAASAAIEQAAQWLLDTPKHQRPGAVVPQLKARFGLNAAQAIEAGREHNLKLARAT